VNNPGYRSALLACELEGKSRHEAASRLGIPEGTLSTHLARGRKLLRERLLRRGVTLGVGPIAGLSRLSIERAIPERLLGPTVRAAASCASGSTTAGTVSQSASSLAERVVKMMFLARLTLVLVALLTASGAVLSVALAVRFSAAAPAVSDPPPAGPDDLACRVVDKSGAGVAGVQVWGMEGDWFTPDTVATATTDGHGKFVVPRVVHLIKPSNYARGLRLFARARDGRVGWLRPDQGRQEAASDVEIELLAVGDARGRLIAQDGKPIAGIEVAPAGMNRTNTDFVWLSKEVRALFRTTTAADGSFILKGVPQGERITATMPATKFGGPMVSWDTSQAVTITLDSRLGRITGRLRLPDGKGVARSLPLGLHGPPRSPAFRTRPFELFLSKDTSTAPDGSFLFDGLPPGRYVIEAYFNQDGIIARQPQTEIDVGPGAAARVEIATLRQPMIRGRIVDARTGKGVAGVGVESLWRERSQNLYVGEAKTDADGRYAVPARPGQNAVRISGMPKPYLVEEHAELPILEVEADRVAPDVTLTSGADLDGIVADGSGRSIPGAEVYYLAATRPGRGGWGREPLRTGPDGSFHVDRLEPDPLVALWARAGDATTGEPVVVRPRELKGKVTLTVDPKNAARIRGLAVDSRGRRIAGAEVTLLWTRSDPVEKGRQRMSSVTTRFETCTTGSDGWFVFRNLWPEVEYKVVVTVRGHNKAESPEVTGKLGETHDLGKVVLIDTSGYLAGQVVGTDGRPIAGAGVFNRGDGPEMVAASTDAAGRFRLEGLFPGSKYAFVRKPGYRFTGVNVDGDAGGLTITLPRMDEPPPPWNPGRGPSRDEQHAFARQVLIRIWEKYGAGAENNGAFPCIRYMAEIDPDLAMQWSAEKGHQYDDEVRQAEARKLADSDPEGALALLNQKPHAESQSALQGLAEQFAGTDAGKALRFAEEAAVQSRGLNQPDRARAMARAGAVLIKLGRSDVGRKLIDEAARDALQLPTARWAGNCRAQVARIVAPFDVERALAIIRPFQAEDRWTSLPATIAVAIATTDTKRALALLETVDRRGFDREYARTGIAYRIGRDRPDEAIRIIEGIDRERWTAAWQSGAFGWLAVALAPRDRARANGLIDRALTTMIDHREWMGPDDEMAVAARVAACARRMGYPDMGGAITRVMAARPAESRFASAGRERHIERLLDAAVHLALIDPDAARAVLEPVEVRGGFDPVTLWNTRGPWLIAWALVDLKKAQAIFEAELAALDREKKEVSLWSTGILNMVQLLIAPPDRREAVLAGRSGGGYWHPDEGF
jgi:hypothetical protein